MMSFSEKSIQFALLKKFYSHEYKFTNVYFFKNESDWLSFLPNGFCYEIEIKISRSDFKADFKKIKHSIHESAKKGTYLVRKGERTVYNPSWEICKDFPELVEARERHSYTAFDKIEVELKYTPCSMIEFKEFANDKLPNKFFYAVPEGLISKEEVPDYAGLLYIKENGEVLKVKDGKFIHKGLHDPKKLFNKTYYAYQRELAEKLRN